MPGAWISYTPQVDQGATTNIAKTVNYAKYVQIGSVVIAQVRLTTTANGTAGNSLSATSPVAAAAAVNVQVGSGWWTDASTALQYRVTVALLVATGQFVFQRTDNTANNFIGIDPNVAVANGDILNFFAMYEGAPTA
jgi:hypothetical protein